VCRWRAPLLVLMMLTLCSAGSAAGDPLTPPTGVCSQTSSQAAVACLINWTRRQAGLSHLRLSFRLERSARVKSGLIGRCGRLVHTACGLPFESQFRAASFPSGQVEVGENLAWGSGPRSTPRAALVAWLASPKHRAVLLRPEWQLLGVSSRRAKLAGSPAGRLYVAQFATYLRPSHSLSASSRS
jgi:uncharacterized protein YkwD